MKVKGLKKYIFLFFILISSNNTIAGNYKNGCNFKTGDFIDEISKPSSIKNIVIRVANSRKYYMNAFRTVLSSKGNGKFIDKKFKKKFKADIEVNYEFGSCSYPAKIWQNGDYKDHIQFIESGQIIRSLNVRLKKGNILNATKFKLFIPSTRGGRAEILAALILKNNGIISPETSEVLVEINNVSSRMIFQEDSQKELLERNLRREGPIFEGDESYMLSNMPDNIENIDNLSLARLINSKWILKGESSQYIALSSFNKLQNSYLEYADKNDGFWRESNYISPNNSYSDIFADYHFLMLSMNGMHALRPHNRKFFFNSFKNYFEPIYYDGDVDFSKTANVNLVKLLNFPKEYKFFGISRLQDLEFYYNLKKEYKLRVINYDETDNKLFDKYYQQFLANAKNIQKTINDQNSLIESKNNLNNFRNTFLERNSKFNLENFIIRSLEIIKNDVYIDLEDGKSFKTNLIGLARILSRKRIDNKRFLFLPDDFQIKNNENLIIKKLNKIDSEIIYPENMKVKIEDKNNKYKLIFTQSYPNQSVLMNGGKLNDVEIIFKGVKRNSKVETNNQRFNYRGLTGCLNIYNADLKNTSIEVSQGQCEDSLNIINSIGSIRNIDILDSFQDAVDLDFSNLKIDNIKIVNGGNDCLDVSAGDYLINKGYFEDCKDKAISIGEKSQFNSNKLKILNSNIAVAIKDYSTFTGDRLIIENTPSCIEVFQKKQEFGGANAKLNFIDCDGKYNIDKNSTLEI